jgi:hypothetical protein
MKYQSNIQKVSFIHEKSYCYFAFFVGEVRRRNGERGITPFGRDPMWGGQQKTDSHHYVGMAILFPYSLKPAV